MELQLWAQLVSISSILLLIIGKEKILIRKDIMMSSHYRHAHIANHILPKKFLTPGEHRLTC